MPGRRMWVLLLLAAVFSMHGLQCMADPSAGHAMTMADLTAMSGTAATGTDMVVHHLPSMTEGLTAGVSAVLPIGADPSNAARALIAVCLAVLGAALGLLGAAVLLVRAGLGARPPTRGSRTSRPRRWARPPDPPELSSLCLLRI